MKTLELKHLRTLGLPAVEHFDFCMAIMENNIQKLEEEEKIRHGAEMEQRAAYVRFISQQFLKIWDLHSFGAFSRADGVQVDIFQVEDEKVEEAELREVFGHRALSPAHLWKLVLGQPVGEEGNLSLKKANALYLLAPDGESHLVILRWQTGWAFFCPENPKVTPLGKGSQIIALSGERP